MKINRDVSLADHTTFKIGGTASHFIAVKKPEDLGEAVSFAAEEKLPIFVLGGGSNVLLSDKGFQGLVIKIEIAGITWQERGGEVEAIVGAGENWDNFVAETVERNLSGLENLSGIPGTVGGAPVQNIGAYGIEVESVIKWVEAFDIRSSKVKNFSRAQCHFSYRDSFFKKPAGKNYIVTRVCLVLHKPGALHLEYKDLKNYFLEHTDIKPTLATVRATVLEIRSKKFPDIKKIGTAGSFFKNPVITKEHYEKLKAKWPDLPGFPLATHYPLLTTHSLVKIPLAWILDKVCNLKGSKHGDAALYEHQPLVVVNIGKASSKEVETLAKKVAAEVKKKTGIELEWEVQVLG